MDVELILVPGLLQTPEYARAVLAVAGIAGLQAETRVAARLGRQAPLSRPDSPEYLAITDESVLRRPVGGKAVMAEQIRQMARAAERPNVAIQVIPYDHGAHAGLSGFYVLLEFAKARTIVHLEHKRSSLFLDEPDDIAPFVATVDTPRNVALDPIDSIEFLKSLAVKYES